jgi:cell division protein ZapA (FtsZ GTPase activity inhibitor)
VKNTVTVKVLDRDYVIRSEDGEEQVRKVADLVNERFGRIREHADGMTEKKIAILAVFDIAGDYLQLVKEHDALRAEFQARLKALNDQIDSTVGSV